jgi:hypothetical protein
LYLFQNYRDFDPKSCCAGHLHHHEVYHSWSPTPNPRLVRKS